MKRFYWVLLPLLLALAGCAVTTVNAEPSVAPSVLSEGQDRQIIEAPSLPAVHEYGEPESLVSHEAHLSLLLLYPKTQIAAFDEVVGSWARQQYEQAAREVGEAREQDQSVHGELNVHYNAYLAPNGFVGIEETGDFMTSHMANSVSVLETFNLDLVTEEVLDNSALIVKDQKARVLDLMHEKLLERYDALAREVMDDEWLRYPVLREEGVAFHLPKGYLPSYYGVQTVLFTYEELDGMLALPDHSGLATTTASPTASPAQTSALPPSPSASGASRTIDPNAPMVALTFDDGPSVTTPRILDLLDQYGGRASFCVIGNRLESKREVMEEIMLQGSEIISHTWSHKNLTNLSQDSIREELRQAHDAILGIGAAAPRWLRPPYGSVDDNVRAVAEEFSYGVVTWSIDTRDWDTRSADATYACIMDEVEDGSIILCHDLYSETGDAMERVIPALAERGYQLVTVSELMEATGTAVVAGDVYRHP